MSASYSFSGMNEDLFPLNLITDPFGSCFGVNLFLLLVENGHYFFLSVCQILVTLIGAVEIKLTHLMSFQRYLEFIDYLDELVHA